jgi:hypothetical protein
MSSVPFALSATKSQPNDVNITYDVTGFLIDKDWFDVIMRAYNKRLGGDNPNGVPTTRFS